MPEATVAAGFARGLLDLAVSKGASEEALAARSQITPRDLEDRDNRIPFANYQALMRAGKALTGDGALALHQGEAANLAEDSIAGLIGQSAATMNEAFGQLNRYIRLVVDVDLGAAIDRFQIDVSAEGPWLIDTRSNPNAFPELTESAFAQMVCWTRQIGLLDWARAVHVTHPAPPHRAEYDRIFRVPVVFESGRNALLLNPQAGQYRIARLPRYVFGVLCERAEALLKRLESSTSLRAEVESLLIPILHSGKASVELIADKMGVSRQTLFRRLKKEGVTFEQVLDELRHQMALHYLNGKKVSVNEAAYLVGFSDPTAFSRAFKRWTGTSPGVLRAQNGGRDR